MNYERSKTVEKFYKDNFNLVTTIVTRYVSCQESSDVVANFFEQKILKNSKKDYFLNENDKDVLKKKLWVAVKNHCIDEVRRGKNNIKTISLEEALNIGGTPILQLQLSFDLQIALNQLAPRQKKAIIMQLEGYKDEEIAQNMESTIEAISQLTYRGRNNLKLFLNKK